MLPQHAVAQIGQGQELAIRVANGGQPHKRNQAPVFFLPRKSMKAVYKCRAVKCFRGCTRNTYNMGHNTEDSEITEQRQKKALLLLAIRLHVLAFLVAHALDVTGVLCAALQRK